ncbi:serine/threonine-protein phosphatase 2A activator [Macrosteles quadrilineatus]|uniref:serine/threonine-protein phosphatase 2A activator n=1 Tax=Macrosteles quadrilineatus TaxID=74068 RepID=UPI0023E10529|nr:serine/threonine-protein phosphatase 2A activator [Macrosteles quadrilineatus]
MDPNMVTVGTMDSSKCLDPETHPFCVPQRGVTSIDAMEIWLKSEAYLEYIGFITAMNREVKGKPLSVSCPESEVTAGVLSLLEKLDVWITETPPIQQPQRFGNKAFKTWYTKVKENALELLQEVLPAKFHRAVPEVKEYFTESFGNSTRIDYGTGHEMSFCMFLCCLYKIGAFVAADNLAVVCKVFNRYMILVRRLQTVYKMEPAGSRGVWALDDYQFIPFIWGSSQLMDHPRIEPRSFTQPDIVDAFAKDYMFLGCIKYINEVKTGPFAEHSNQLWNISGVGYWGKVNEGLIKMYKAEVLAKFPVIQHVLFGSLLPLVVAPVPQTTVGKRPPGQLSRESLTRPPVGGFGKPTGTSNTSILSTTSCSSPPSQAPDKPT